MEAVKLLPWCVPTVVPFCYISRVVTIAAQQDEGHPHHIWALSHCIWSWGWTWAWASWLTRASPLWWSNSSSRNFTSTSVFSIRHPLGRHSIHEVPLFWLPSCSLSGKVRPLSQWFTWQSSHQKDPCLLPKDEAGVESSSTQGDQDTPKLILETGHGPSSEQGWQEPASLPSPYSASLGLVGGTTAESPKHTKDLIYSSSKSSRGNVDDSNMDTASQNCLSCSDTDDASVWTAHKKYRKRVWTFCKLSKSNLWMETQQKRMNKSHQDC